MGARFIMDVCQYMCTYVALGNLKREETNTITYIHRSGAVAQPRAQSGRMPILGTKRYLWLFNIVPSMTAASLEEIANATQRMQSDL